MIRLILGFTAAYLVFDIFIWALQPEWLESYGEITGIVSHAWAIPALILARKRYKEIFEHLFATVVVSAVYHACDAYSDDETLVRSMQRADHGFSVGLVALLVLHRIHDVWYLPVSFFGILSASFSFMNLITTGFIGLVGTVLYLPQVMGTMQSLGLIARTFKIDNPGVMWIVAGIAVQTIGIVFFFVEIPPFTQSFHAWWHITSFLGVYCILKALAYKDGTIPYSRVNSF